MKEPKPDIRTAFRVVVDNNWQGIAYLMLEVAGLDFVEAIQVMTWINKSLQRKIKLLSKKRKLLKVEKKFGGSMGSSLHSPQNCLFREATEYSFTP